VRMDNHYCCSLSSGPGINTHNRGGSGDSDGGGGSGGRGNS
jgi:hypothetical protein